MSSDDDVEFSQLISIDNSINIQIPNHIYGKRNKGCTIKKKQKNNNNNTINLIHILQQVFVYSVCALVNGPAYRSNLLARHPSPVIVTSPYESVVQYDKYIKHLM